MQNPINIRRLLLATSHVLFLLILWDWAVSGIVVQHYLGIDPAIWRTAEAQEQNLFWMTLGQAIIAVVFCYFYAVMYPGPGIKQGVIFGSFVGVLLSSTLFILYTIIPLPQAAILAWAVSGVFEGSVAGALVAWLYRPAVKTSAVDMPHSATT